MVRNQQFFAGGGARATLSQSLAKNLFLLSAELDVWVEPLDVWAASFCVTPTVVAQ